MVYIKFLNDLELHKGNAKTKSKNVVSLEFENSVAINSSGFKTYRDTLMKEQMGDFSDYTTVYDVETFSLSNDGSEKPIPIPTSTPEPIPEPTHATVTFVSSGNGELDGELVQVVEIGANTDELQVPTPIPNDKYEFKNWTPNIEGTITRDITYSAIFELQYEYTTEGRLTIVENTVNNLMGVVE